jgi:hypothetical protein
MQIIKRVLIGLGLVLAELFIQSFCDLLELLLELICVHMIGDCVIVH